MLTIISFNREGFSLRLPNVPPPAFTLSAVVVGFLLVDNATPNEQNALGNWLMLVAQYLCTNAAYGQLLQSNAQTPGSFSENQNNSSNPNSGYNQNMNNNNCGCGR